MYNITWPGLVTKASRIGNLGDYIEDEAVVVVGRAGHAGAESIRGTINSGAGTQKGGPRIKSHAMINSVGVTSLGFGPVAESYFGYINNTPEWTQWQEGGTSRGIPAMLSMVSAAQVAETTLAAETIKLGAKVKTRWDRI